jgi:NAD(P)-dependent dehydrogenase (short-subunit alcohol dehydrogenase family)
LSRSFEGRVAVITGASRGIGAACARRLASDGAAVVLAARTEETLARTTAELQSAGYRALAVRADVSVMSDLERLALEAEREFGGIDIVVNNAALFPELRAPQDITSEEYDLGMSTNLKSAWYLSKLAYPVMKRRGGGSVIHMSSASGYYHWNGELLYSLPKAGLFALARILAKEWGPDNIRVNSVAPGWVRTDMADGMLDQMRKEGRSPNLLDTVGEPEEIAELVAYLCSDAARFMTGGVIRIDGGGRPGWL